MILREHEADKDSQAILREVVAYYEQSSMAKNRASTLFGQITNMKLHSTRWNGTIRNFILQWVDKVREYHHLAGPSNIITESMKKAILMNMVKSDSKLNDVIIRDMQRQRDGELEYNYDTFLEHLLQTADIIDGAVGSMRRPVAANMHERYDHYDTIEQLGADLEDMRYDDNESDHQGDEDLYFNYTNRSRRSEFGPTVDGATWRSLNKDDQRVWNSLSPDGREKIAKFFNQRKKGIGSAPSMPKGSSMSTISKFYKMPKTTATDNTRTTIKTHEQDRESLDECEQDDEEQTVDDEVKMILSQARQDKSTKKFLHKFLGKKPPKSPPTTKQADRDINCTRIVYRVTNNGSSDAQEKGGLVDRGANGGLAGKDLRVIALTDRWVDITGINDIRIDNFRIGTAGGVVKTQKGPVMAVDR